MAVAFNMTLKMILISQKVVSSTFQFARGVFGTQQQKSNKSTEVGVKTFGDRIIKRTQGILQGALWED